MREIVMHENPAKLHAQEFLREGLIRQMPDYIITILDRVGATACRQDQFVVPPGVRASETIRHGLAREDHLIAIIVVCLLVVKSPDPCEVRNRRSPVCLIGSASYPV